MAEPDLSEFHKLSARKSKAKPCPVLGAIDSLKGKECDQLQAALDESEGTITHVAIAKWMRAREFDVHWQAVRNHRKGRCRCGQD